METLDPHRFVLGENCSLLKRHQMLCICVNSFSKHKYIVCVFLLLFAQMADAMEMMILSILAPQLHCEWRLPSLEVALLTSVIAL